MLQKLVQIAALLSISLPSCFLWAEAPGTSVAASSPNVGVVDKVGDKDLALIKAIDSRYQKAKAVSMSVEKTVKLGILQQERKAKGSLVISKSRMRMDLDGYEKTSLIINDKKIFAVTYPAPEFKGAALQVLTGDVTSKKAQSQSLLGLLSQGGFLKFFKATGLQRKTGDQSVFFLNPKKDQNEIKRLQIVVDSQRKEIKELRFWDDRDNETHFVFGEIKFADKTNEEQFIYNPPADADVMSI